MDSPLIWAGSKRWLVPSLAEACAKQGIIFDEKTRLVELFAGGASVALGLEPAVALLNDTNLHLINFWRHASRAAINGRCYSADDAAFYTEIRAMLNGEPPEGELQAERFYALNHWCFNGIWRVNQNGKFNVPKRKRVVALPSLPDYTKLMALWAFTCQDFGRVLLQPGDFVFADPPYDDGFTGYTGIGFDWNQQKELAVFLACHRGPVVATNKATRRMQELYTDCGFQIELCEGTQRMHRSRGRTDDNLEMIAYKGLTWVL
jgi:DNA adenine methylase